jgi:hypothetical protein
MKLSTPAAATDLPDRFVQSKVEIDSLQIINSSGEIFNHFDDALEMWSGEGDRLLHVDISFTRGFLEAPSISLGVTGLDAARENNLRFWLTTRGCSTWSRPQLKRVVADPNRQITAPPQAFIVLGTVGHPTLLLRDLGATISVELVRHLQHPQEDWTQPVSVQWGSMQQRRVGSTIG